MQHTLHANLLLITFKYLLSLKMLKSLEPKDFSFLCQKENLLTQSSLTVFLPNNIHVAQCWWWKPFPSQGKSLVCWATDTILLHLAFENTLKTDDNPSLGFSKTTRTLDEWFLKVKSINFTVYLEFYKRKC